MKSETWPVSKLKNWDKNPRSINKKDFDRLKHQIKKLGIYKPLLITPEGVVLGGNMRLRAIQELKIPEAWVSIVEPKNEKEMVEFALSDNDRGGYYDEAQLAELVYQFKGDLDFTQFSVDYKEPMNLQDFVFTFSEIPMEDQAGIDAGAIENFKGRYFTAQNKGIISVGYWVVILDKDSMAPLEKKLLEIKPDDREKVARKLVTLIDENLLSLL